MSVNSSNEPNNRIIKGKAYWKMRVFDCEVTIARFIKERDALNESIVQEKIMKRHCEEELAKAIDE
jgi:hypothetical protein